ncbi:hypothetical protein [Pontibacter harenae]|nr:hypothetical protein [Pontibacter harenae]
MNNANYIEITGFLFRKGGFGMFSISCIISTIITFITPFGV